MHARLRANTVLVAGLLVMVVPPAVGCDEPQPSYKDKQLPELVTKDGKWFNTEQPATLASVRGKPALVVLTTLW